MKNKKNFIVSIIAATVLTAFLVSFSAQVQRKGITRTELQRSDLSTPGREFVQVRIDFDPQTTFGHHSHPGEEVIYVLEGFLEYEIAGRAPVTLKAGEVLFIPSDAIHSAKNVGKSKAKELATYIVEKGKPLVTLAK
jgi:quercetin dioxygenase-like cupin family protein